MADLLTAVDHLEVLSANLPRDWFLLTGSLWVGGFNPRSDIDFVVPPTVVLPMYRAYGTLNVGACRIGRLNLIRFASSSDLRDYRAVNDIARVVGKSRGWDNKAQRIKFFRAMADDKWQRLDAAIVTADYTIPYEMGIREEVLYEEEW